ncbi:MAG: PHB depolymerase family esterase [Rhodobacteraceae bacterium]|nr:PHB depolymerase family esterase [Paracoccaceae bacterium]
MSQFRFSRPAALLAGTLLAVPAAAQELPRLTLDPDATTVSGLSSGAFMTVQMHIAFSGRIAGAGVVAGGPYDCAQDQLLTAISSCMSGTGGLPDPEDSVLSAQDNAAAGVIDPLDGLTGDRIYLFSGTRDDTVIQPVMDVARDFYMQMGIAEDALRYVTDVPAGHAFLAPDAPVPCGETETPFLNDCGIDQAGDILSWVYGDLAAPVAAVPAHLQRFDQGDYLSDPSAHSMADEGFVYVPQSCADGDLCKLHIVFHGCKQGIDRLGDLYATGTGYNAWAEANGIVVLYPQAISSLLEGNPNGCWDWWGYDDPDYATRNGPQMAAVAQMATALGVPLVGPGTGDPVCISHEAFNSVHWQQDRAAPCGFGLLCAQGSGDRIGNWFGASTLFETGVGAFQLENCAP